MNTGWGSPREVYTCGRVDLAVSLLLVQAAGVDLCLDRLEESAAMGVIERVEVQTSYVSPVPWELEVRAVAVCSKVLTNGHPNRAEAMAFLTEAQVLAMDEDDILRWVEKLLDSVRAAAVKPRAA